MGDRSCGQARTNTHALLLKGKGTRGRDAVLSLPWAKAWLVASIAHADANRDRKPRRGGLVARGKL